MDEDVYTYLFDISIIFFLLIINGILAMTEIAIVSANHNKIKIMAKNSRSAEIAAQLMNNPGQFFSTIQIGITIIGIISGAFSGSRLAEPLGNWLNQFAWMHNKGYAAAFSFVVLIITYVSLIIGELIPKRLALARPEKTAVFFSLPIAWLSKVAYPFVIVLDYSAQAVMKLLGQKETKENTITEEEINNIMQQGLAEGAIDAFEHNVFQRVLKFGDREAGIIMTPKLKTVVLDLQFSDEENKRRLFSFPHSYYPVFNGGENEFAGIVDAKDILRQIIQGLPFDLKSLLKKAPCVIEDNLGPDLLNEFKRYGTRMALVVDEYGEMQGVITLTDLFETLVGEIPESDKVKHYEIVERSDGSWLCDGISPIDDIEELLKTSITTRFEEEDFNTLAGFMLMLFRHIPSTGEKVQWNGFSFEIVDLDGPRIDKVLIYKTNGVAGDK